MTETQTDLDLKVCWGVREAGFTTYYKQAGTLKFITPPTMSQAEIYLTTKQAGAIAPSVLYFKTDPTRSEYATTEGKTKLVLRFLDVRSEDGVLKPYFAQDTPYTCEQSMGCPTEPAPDEEVAYEDAAQYLCGKLFNELWTEASEGFPVPKGCYYSPRYRDAADPGASENTNPFYREITIVFHEKNGLMANTKYMIVMNTNAPVALDPNAEDIKGIDLISMCAEETGCERPYKVFEKSTANVASQTVQRGNDLNNPRLASGGFTIQTPGDEGTINLSEMNVIQVLIRGGAGLKAIKPQAVLRMILWPLTSWNIGPASCTAQCIPFHENSAAICSGTVACDSESVVRTAYHNAYQVVKLRLPSDMTDITDITTHTVKVTSLTLPKAGFFPLRAGVQLTKDDDSEPQYTTSAGFMWKNPEDGETEGRLVLTGATGSGPKPFAGDANNKLVVRLKFGATLWNWGETSLASLFEVQLPPGYTCNVLGSGDPSADLDVFKVDSDNDDYPDNRRGLLAVSQLDGDWARSMGQSCQYELYPYNRIYAGQVVYIEFDVINPTSPMRKDFIDNVWSIQLSSKGADANNIRPGGPSMPYVDFTSNSAIQSIENGPTYFQGSAAVINELVDPLFQPGESLKSFTRSCCGTSFSQRRTQQYMRVFFRPGVTVGQRGYVVVDAPDMFDFGETCVVKDLPDAYYAYAGDLEYELRILKPPIVCEGERYPPLTAQTYNRASIRVSGLIDTIDLVYYGFTVLVTHPTSYDPLMNEQWKLWLEDSMGYSLEGSKDTVKFNPKQAATQTLFYHKSWGLYNDYIDGIVVNIADLRPYDINLEDSLITIHSITFPEATQTSLRITAPLGYIWNTNWNNFVATANCGEGVPCEDFGGAGGVLPQVEGTVENALVWGQVVFEPDIKYGFQHKIRVPLFSPRISANAFFFEFGYEKAEITERIRAVALEAAPVAAMINCKVGYNTNQVGITDNRMQFEFQTQTEVSYSAGIIIVGDMNCRGFTFTPEYVLLEGSDPLPGDLTLSAGTEADMTPIIQLKVQGTPISPGHYKIELKVANPGGRILTPGIWTFGSYNDVSMYPTKYYLDNEMQTPGFVINNRMSYAGFYALNDRQKTDTDREDRPGYMNNLIFEFMLRTRPEEVQDMLLKAPHGFIFEDDCLGSMTSPKLKTDFNTVFGENTGGIWPGDLEVWQSTFAPVACVGDGRDARITIPIGLELAVRYAFRIRVQNPLNSPEWNKWTLNYNKESSDPFPGFNIWTSVGNPTAVPVSYARNQGGSTDPIVNPVTLTFKPYKNVPAKPAEEDKGGVVRVEVPSNFRFVHDNNMCEVDLRVTGASTPILPNQLECEVDNSETKLNLYMIGNVAISGEESGNGQEYQLIVYVFNPNAPQEAADWHLNTYSKYTREPEFSLDESQIPGFPIHNDLWRYSVSNVLGEYNGNKRVSEVEIVLSFRDHVKDGDKITVYSPRGFNIVSNPEMDTCDNYRPVGASPDWFPFTGAPECVCEEIVNGPACHLQWKKIKEGKDPAFAQKQDIRFKIATTNPPKTPFIAFNFWRAEHHSSTEALLASQISKSWEINPQLANVDVAFANGYRSAGSQANLDFIFTPVNDACCLEIQAEYPTEFDFTQSTVFSNYDILLQEGSRMLINLRSPGLIADQEISIRVYNVRLGRGGGQTRWNLITYLDDLMTIPMDEALQFEGGFRLPGKIVLQDEPILTSAWKESALMYPVKSLFQPRVGEWASAEFRLSFSQAVMAQGKLIISCQGAGDQQGYSLRTDSFVVIGTGQIDAIPVLDESSGAIQATLKANRPATETALLPDTPYTVSFRVYPHNDGTNTWRFDTTDSAEGFTNTNDGETQGFAPVQNFLLTVTVVRSPPKAIIEVKLDVDQGTAVIRELLIIAPPGFQFDEGPDGCGDMCMPGQALGSTGRRTATLASPTGQPLTVLTGLRIRVQTPEQTPIGTGSEGIMWFVEGRSQGAGTTKGWGQGSGFAVTQMSGSAVYYAGVANLRATEIAFTFTLDVDAGSSISIVPPAGFLLTCSMEGSLKTISLPGGRPNCIDDPLQLQLLESLTRGTYAFGVTVDLPPQTPEVNTFNIIIQDQYNNVVDAAYAIQGEEVVDLGAEAPSLAWSRADPGQPSVITIGITFTRDTSNLKALLVTLPELFQHDVQIPIDVQNLNPRFPLAPGLDWADTEEPDRIRIFLDDSEDVTTIPADTYRFSFPVLMPPDVPRKNIWFISLCDDRTCKQPSDAQVLVSFPMAGFNLYDVAPEALRVSASGAVRRATSGGFDLGVCLLLALLSLLKLYSS